MLMASLRLNIPVIFVFGGPMESGKMNLSNKIKKINLIDAMINRVNNDIDDISSKKNEYSACPTCGSCSGMFTQIL